MQAFMLLVISGYAVLLLLLVAAAQAALMIKTKITNLWKRKCEQMQVMTKEAINSLFGQVLEAPPAAVDVYSPQRTNYAETLAIIGRRLSDNRARHGLTLADVSRETGMSQSTLSRIDRGLCDRYSAIAAYADTLYTLTGTRVSIVDLSGRNW